MKVNRLATWPIGIAGVIYQLVRSETIIHLNKIDVISITIETENATKDIWWLFINFAEREGVADQSLTTSFDGPGLNNNTYTCNVFLNNWYSDEWVENKEPIEFQSKDGKTKILLKIRSTANISQPYRQTTVSIWTKVI